MVTDPGQPTTSAHHAITTLNLSPTTNTELTLTPLLLIGDKILSRRYQNLPLQICQATYLLHNKRRFVWLFNILWLCCKGSKPAYNSQGWFATCTSCKVPRYENEGWLRSVSVGLMIIEFLCQKNFWLSKRCCLKITSISLFLWPLYSLGTITYISYRGSL